MNALAQRGATRRASDAAPAPAVTSPPQWTFEWIYFVFVVAMWCFIPLARRLLDWHNGFYNPIQITSTFPYLATFPLAFVAFRKERLARIAPAFRFFAWVWVAIFAYALIVALFAGNTAAAAYEAVQYLGPVLFGIWLAGQPLDDRELMTRLSTIVLTCGALVACYGLVQFVSPPPWDAMWLEGGHFLSMGPAEPFRIRVFATLNSAGPAADFFGLGIILALPLFDLRRPWIWPLVGALGAALLLTLVRASWIGVVLGVMVYLLASPRRFRAIPFIAIYGAAMIFLVASLPAFLGAGGNSDVVSSRLATLGDVDHDDSALARSEEIRAALESGLGNPIGSGLGQIGASSALSANPETPGGNNLDSGYMARLLELGWAGFAGYLVVVIGSFAALLMSVFAPARGHTMGNQTRVIVATAAAMCGALMWGDAAGDSHLGLDGVLFWIAMGIGFRRPAISAALARVRRLRR